jgi:hypothetical protein
MEMSARNIGFILFITHEISIAVSKLVNISFKQSFITSSTLAHVRDISCCDSIVWFEGTSTRWKSVDRPQKQSLRQ